MDAHPLILLRECASGSYPARDVAQSFQVISNSPASKSNKTWRVK